MFVLEFSLYLVLELLQHDIGLDLPLNGRPIDDREKQIVHSIWLSVIIWGFIQQSDWVLDSKIIPINFFNLF